MAERSNKQSRRLGQQATRYIFLFLDEVRKSISIVWLNCAVKSLKCI